MNVKIIAIIAVIMVIITAFFMLGIDLPTFESNWGKCYIKDEQGKTVIEFNQKISIDGVSTIPGSEPIPEPEYLAYALYAKSDYAPIVVLIDSYMFANIQIYPEDNFVSPIKTLQVKATVGGTAKTIHPESLTIYTKEFTNPFSDISPGIYSVRLELTGTATIACTFVQGEDPVMFTKAFWDADKSVENSRPTFKIEVM